MPTSAFWTHAGATFIVQPSQVAYAWTEDADNGAHLLCFLYISGHITKIQYAQVERRNAAFLLFQEFVSAASTAIDAP
jgi:hypothetical protein